MKGPLPRYNELVTSGALDADEQQRLVVERLQTLSDAFTRKSTWPFSKPKPPRGVYIWGGVGRGKSLLMDIFLNNTDTPSKRRVHFHEFMAETHERIDAWRKADLKTKKRHKAFNRKSPDDPMPPVALDIAQDAMLLCFDEFQVSDIADAMILARLFEHLLAQGVVIVSTSNRHPDDLYKDGINRQLFIPAIQMIKSHMDVLELDAARDYRLERLTGAKVYHYPLDEGADRAMDETWARLICGAREHAEEIPVLGRKLAVPRAARDAARFTFQDLCAKPLGANDYLALARRYTTLFVDHIPAMGPESRNEARRFVNLIDTVYEARTKFVCSAAGPPEALYPAGDGSFEFERTVSRLIEMQSADYLGAEHVAELESA